MAGQLGQGSRRQSGKQGDAPQDAVQINTRLPALESEIEKAMVRWELLEARAAGK